MTAPAMRTSRPRLLSIDDEYGMREVVMGIGSVAGYESFGAAGIRDVEAALDAGPDVVVLDLIMPEQDGIEVIWNMASRKSSAAIIILSGYDEVMMEMAKTIARSNGLNVVATLKKPIDGNDLKERLVSLRKAPNEQWRFK